MTVPSYSDIFHIGHAAIREMWDGPIEIQEKVDGSQISFMLDEDEQLIMRSKGQQLIEGAPSSGMFQPAIDSIKERADLLVPGQIWRGEYLSKPKHNTLAYNRIPAGHVVIFDIQLSLGEFAQPKQRTEMASFLGLESIPSFFSGRMEYDPENLKRFLERESFLGGQKIEGIVAKSYLHFYGGKPMMGKLVSEKFKEVHQKEWKVGNPGKKDVIETLIESYAVEARWNKAIQHLREAGTLTNSPQDIGPLLKEIAADIQKEEEDAIKDALFKWAWPQISRGTSRGFPQWYKDKLLEVDND